MIRRLGGANDVMSVAADAYDRPPDRTPDAPARTSGPGAWALDLLLPWRLASRLCGPFRTFRFSASDAVGLAAPGNPVASTLAEQAADPLIERLLLPRALLGLGLLFLLFLVFRLFTGGGVPNPRAGLQRQPPDAGHRPDRPPPGLRPAHRPGPPRHPPHGRPSLRPPPPDGPAHGRLCGARADGPFPAPDHRRHGRTARREPCHTPGTPGAHESSVFSGRTPTCV